jgi:hypothetical protein
MHWSKGARVVFAIGLGACSSNGSTTGGSANDGGATDTSVATGYATSACGTCVAQACATSISACNSDPDCASYLSCLDACGVGGDGNVDPTCAAACPTGNSTSGMRAEEDLTDCRADGAGAACAACGVDGGGGNPIVDQTCTPMTDTTECATCEDDHCCQTYANCHANPDCHAMQTCLVDCLSGVADDAGAPHGGAPDGGSCETICGDAHPQGLVDWAPRDACLLLNCTVMCENAPMPPLSACDACEFQSCANEYANFDGTPDGYLLGACIAACPTGSPCENACFIQYPTAMAAAYALFGCTAQNCPSCN